MYVKKLLLIFLILLTFFSCDTGNLYQDIGLGGKPELRLTYFSTLKIADDGKVNLFSLFDADSNLSYDVEFKRALSSEDASYLLKIQDVSQMAKTVEILTAPCFSDSELKSFLSSNVTNLILLDSIANAEAALKDTEANIKLLISKINSLKLSKDNEGSLSDETIDEINSYIDKTYDALTSFFDDFYSSLDEFLGVQTSAWQWADYLRIQLTMDLIGGVLQGVNQSYKTIADAMKIPEDQNFDFTTEEGISEFMDFVKNNISVAGKGVIVSFVSSLIDPLSTYISVTERLKNTYDLGLVTVDDVVELFVGENK